MLYGYARSLRKGGYASLFEDLQSGPCQERTLEILEGKTHAGFPRPKEFDVWEREHEKVKTAMDLLPADIRDQYDFFRLRRNDLKMCAVERSDQ